MTALVGVTDGRAECVWCFNDRAEAEAFKRMSRDAVGVIWDRIDLVTVEIPSVMQDFIREELESLYNET